LREAVKLSFSACETLKRLGMSPYGYASLRLLVRLNDLGIDHSHFTSGKRLSPQQRLRNRSLDEILTVVDLPVAAHSLKRRLFKEGLLENKCSLCGLVTWREKKISLHLDHIDGNNRNNSLSNLRLLCPNCHSQTDTYCGRNKNKSCKKEKICNLVVVPSHTGSIKMQNKNQTLVEKKRRKNYFCSCGLQKSANAVRCVNCHSKLSFKIEWPSDENLHKLLWSSPTEKIALQLGVSDSAISKRCRQRNIDKPPKGYWTKVAFGVV
jgi:hypothetical protein